MKDGSTFDNHSFREYIWRPAFDKEKIREYFGGDFK